jgi:hypothetical protein
LGSKKLDIAAIFKVQLEVLGIQTELSKSAANLPGSGVIGGWPCPPLVSSLVLKLEKTAVVKKQRRFIELCIRDIAGECFSSEIGAAHCRTF